jgi:1-acyl-sn-glycerol-3-phosphate acyltransferase
VHISVNERRFIFWSTKLFFAINILALGLKRIPYNAQYEEVYRKYLGPDYKFEFGDNYSTLISNHTSWVDIVYHLYFYAPGFVSKAAVRTFPLIGKIAQQINCLFVKRESEENRHLIVIYFKYK